MPLPPQPLSPLLSCPPHHDGHLIIGSNCELNKSPPHLSWCCQVFCHINKRSNKAQVFKRQMCSLTSHKIVFVFTFNKLIAGIRPPAVLFNQHSTLSVRKEQCPFKQAFWFQGFKGLKLTFFELRIIRRCVPGHGTTCRQCFDGCSCI